MLKKSIVIVLFLGIFSAFFIVLDNMNNSIKQAERAGVVQQEIVKVKEKTKNKIKKAEIVGQDPVTAGYGLFKRRCLGCHTSDKGAPNRTGPNLWGIVNRPKGSSEGFRYSRQLHLLGGVWTEAEISTFIAGPRAMIKDTKMTFSGIKIEKARLNIIAYLKTLKD